VEETELVELVRELVEAEEELVVEEENDPLVEETDELLVEEGEEEEEEEKDVPVAVVDEDELELVEGVELSEAKYIPAPASTSMTITIIPMIDLEIAALLEAIKRTLQEVGGASNKSSSVSNRIPYPRDENYSWPGQKCQTKLAEQKYKKKGLAMRACRFARR